MTSQLNPPLVSIVITSYNYAKYIRDALQSVSEQTYRPLECIVVDDCSTDNSAEVINAEIEELSKKNNDISYTFCSTGKNSGQLTAFLLGISKTRGVFINFLDADDFLLPDFISTHVQVHLENLVAFTTSEPIEIDSENQVHSFQSNSGNAYTALKTERNIRPVLPFEEWRKSLNEGSEAQNFKTSGKYILNRSNLKWNSWYWYPTSSGLFRKSALRYLCKADPEKWRICADWLLFSYASIMGNSSFIPCRLSVYRRHGDNGFALDALIGEYRYVTKKKRMLSDEFQYKQLPLSLIRIFACLKDDFPDLSDELIKTVIYHSGPDFLLKNRDEVFSYLIYPHFYQRVILYLKTWIRNRQLNKKNCNAIRLHDDECR